MIKYEVMEKNIGLKQYIRPEMFIVELSSEKFLKRSIPSVDIVEEEEDWE